MQSMIEIDFCYQGVTLDERMAICRLFGKDDGDVFITEHLSDALLAEGPLQ